MNAKIPPLVVDNFAQKLKLKNTKPLTDLVAEVMKTLEFKDKRSKALKDAAESFAPKPVSEAPKKEPVPKDPIAKETHKKELTVENEPEDEDLDEEEEEEMEEEEEEEEEM